MTDYFALVGKSVRVTLKSGEIREGYVLTYTPAYDNEPQIETIDLLPTATARHGEGIPTADIAGIELLQTAV
jgi:hypothetical protein